MFRSLLEIGQVDQIELGVIPVLLGGGVPFLPPPAGRYRLRLAGREVYPNGMVRLACDVLGAG